MEFIAIGDVHGCYKTFLELVKKLPSNCLKILTGDLIDRGPSSKEMLDFMINHPDEFKSVLGNHEYFMLKVLDDPDYFNIACWRDNGGFSTLRSYGLSFGWNSIIGDLDKIPEDHIEYIRNLPKHLIMKNVLLSHAAYNTSISLEEASTDLDSSGSIIWNRSIPDKNASFAFQILGHTPNINPVITDYYANIDTACVYETMLDKGKLTALHYPSMTVYQQEKID